MKYKVGDRVKVIEEDCCTTGMEGTIVVIDKTEPKIGIKFDERRGLSW